MYWIVETIPQEIDEATVRIAEGQDLPSFIATLDAIDIMGIAEFTARVGPVRVTGLRSWVHQDWIVMVIVPGFPPGTDRGPTIREAITRAFAEVLAGRGTFSTRVAHQARQVAAIIGGDQ